MIAKQMGLPAHAEDPDAEEERLEGECVGFGYTELGRGCEHAEVFDAEAEGARHGLKAAVALFPEAQARPRITICLDNTGLRGTPAASLQAAFLDFRATRKGYSPSLIPGYKGNEIADGLTKAGAEGGEVVNKGLATLAYSKRLSKREAQSYIDYRLGVTIKLNNELKELDRRSLYYLLAARSSYGDFKAYYERFEYEDTLLTNWKNPFHPFFYKKVYTVSLVINEAATRENFSLTIGIYWQRFIARIQTSYFFSGTVDNLTGFLRGEGIEEVTADLDRLVYWVRRREEVIRDNSEGENSKE
ncbi:LOW QUALITY PROTEIN: hypothetical protein QBC45DRAFT_453789 [Copromyces sp. CBS 386.78]|nr:LOW QUALITY PROTEIN: hypothetical protein QBC45DRAFT_453789 [Copromyces sp. CBS 386.78]